MRPESLGSGNISCTYGPSAYERDIHFFSRVPAHILLSVSALIRTFHTVNALSYRHLLDKRCLLIWDTPVIFAIRSGCDGPSGKSSCWIEGADTEPEV